MPTRVQLPDGSIGEFAATQESNIAPHETRVRRGEWEPDSALTRRFAPLHYSYA